VHHKVILALSLQVLRVELKTVQVQSSAVLWLQDLFNDDIFDILFEEISLESVRL
jgi:hypothetical protein